MAAATLLFVVAVFAARPIAFIPALLPAKLSWMDRLLIAWFGPRALSSLLLVLLPVFAGLPQADHLFTICCLVVLFSVLLHGLSPSLLIKPAAKLKPPDGLAPARASETDVKAALQPAAPQQCSIGPDACPMDLSVPSPSDPEYISLAEVKTLQERPDQVIIIDARSERTYNESDQEIPGAIRLHPDEATRTAGQLGIPKGPVLAVLCA